MGQRNKGRADHVREQAPDPPSLRDAELFRRRDELDQRLEDGYMRIEEAASLGKTPRTISAWEDFWMTLLHEYEEVCNELQRVGR